MKRYEETPSGGMEHNDHHGEWVEYEEALVVEQERDAAIAQLSVMNLALLDLQEEIAHLRSEL